MISSLNWLKGAEGDKVVISGMNMPLTVLVSEFWKQQKYQITNEDDPVIYMMHVSKWYVVALECTNNKCVVGLW